MKPTTHYIIYEGLMAFAFIGTGVNLATGNYVIAAFYGIVAILSYNQALILGKQLDIVPFYQKWL